MPLPVAYKIAQPEPELLVPFTDRLPLRERAGGRFHLQELVLVGSSVCPNISSSAVSCFVTFVPGNKRQERGGGRGSQTHTHTHPSTHTRARTHTYAAASNTCALWRVRGWDGMGGRDGCGASRASKSLVPPLASCPASASDGAATRGSAMHDSFGLSATRIHSPVSMCQTVMAAEGVKHKSQFSSSTVLAEESI